MDRSSHKCSMRLSTPTCRSGSSLALRWLSAWRSCCLEGVPSPNLSRFGIVLAEKVRHQRRAQPVWRVKIAPNIRDRLFHKSILLVRLQALHQGLRPLLEMLGQHVQIVVVLRFRPLQVSRSCPELTCPKEPDGAAMLAVFVVLIRLLLADKMRRH